MKTIKISFKVSDGLLSRIFTSPLEKEFETDLDVVDVEYLVKNKIDELL